MAFSTGLGWPNLFCLLAAAYCVRDGIKGGPAFAFRSGVPIPERQGQFLSFMIAAGFYCSHSLAEIGITTEVAGPRVANRPNPALF